MRPAIVVGVALALVPIAVVGVSRAQPAPTVPSAEAPPGASPAAGPIPAPAPAATSGTEPGATEPALPPPTPPGATSATPVPSSSTPAVPTAAAPTAPGPHVAPPVAPAPAPPETTSDAIGLSFGAGVSSLYYFRGLNVFQLNGQADVHALLELSAGYAVADTGLSFGYWGAYQLNGPNRALLVDAGVGHEQDVIVRFEREATEGLKLGAGFTYYFYPFAAEEAAGTAVPAYLEPGAWLVWSTVLDLGLNVSYFAGLQNALERYRYLYVNPFVGKVFDLSTSVDVGVAVAAGFKIYNYPSQMPDNRFDVRFDWTTPIDAGSGVTVTPGAHLGWTDRADLGIGDEYTAWLSLNSALAL